MWAPLDDAPDWRRWLDRVDVDAVRVILLTVLGSLVGSLVADRAAAVPGIPLAAGLGIVLALGVTFGTTVALGAGLGGVLTDVVVGAFGVHSTVSYVVGFVAVLVTITYWNTLGRWPRALPGPYDRSARFLIAGAPGVAVAAAVDGWGGEVLGRRAFSTAFGTVLLEGTVALVVVGVPCLLLVDRIDGEATSVRAWREADGYRFAGTGVTLVATLTIVGWGIGGSVVRTLLGPLQTGAYQAIANRFGWIVANLVRLAGNGGRWFNVALGTVAGLVLLTAFIRGTVGDTVSSHGPDSNAS